MNELTVPEDAKDGLAGRLAHRVERDSRVEEADRPRFTRVDASKALTVRPKVPCGARGQCVDIDVAGRWCGHG